MSVAYARIEDYEITKPVPKEGNSLFCNFYITDVICCRFSSMGTQTANGQANVSSCEKIPISKVGANGVRGAATANFAVDNDLDTRWANEAVGSFIQIDFDKSEVVCDIEIAWFKGAERSYNFVVSSSEDGVNFRDIVSLASTGHTASAEKYDITDQPAKNLRVTVHGNTHNDLASIKEMSVQGKAATAEPVCTATQLTGVTATGNDGNIPDNTIDNNPNTRWSNFGFPSSIQYDVGKSQPICEVDISWYRGNARVNTFTISASTDGQNFVPIFSGRSSGTTVAAEPYDVTDTNARYVKITVDANSQNNNWASITEVDINARSPAPAPSPNECKIPTITTVSATGDDGNLPQNTIDNNANTRWSNFGFPSSIQYDVGKSQPICEVDISWYRGNTRVNTFTISASTDGQNFVPIFSGRSSGTTDNSRTI